MDSIMSSAIQRRTLAEINFENANNIYVIAVVIGVLEPRYFTSKITSEEKGVITFTVRDSEKHFCNCKIWGQKERIIEYYMTFNIGAVVYIAMPRITSTNSTGESSEQYYQPITSVPYQLTINEGAGSSMMINTEKLNCIIQLKNLVNIPLKSPNSALSLADVHDGGGSTPGQHVDLLVIIKRIGNLRIITASSSSSVFGGNQSQCIDVIVMDKSFPSGVLMTLWRKDWSERAANIWKRTETVLQIIDARIGYSTFHKLTTLGMSNRTLIIENVACKQAEDLRIFARTVPVDDDDFFKFGGLPDPDSITNVMTAARIYDRLEGNIDNSEQFTCQLISVVTKFDLDRDTTSQVIAKKCNFCKRKIPFAVNFCSNAQCHLNLSINSGGEKFTFYFDINVHLTDHTGTVCEGKLTKEIAESTLGVSLMDFQNMSVDDRSKLKWKFLMERVRAKLFIKNGPYPLVLIVQLQLMGIDDVAEKILLY